MTPAQRKTMLRELGLIGIAVSLTAWCMVNSNLEAILWFAAGGGAVIALRRLRA